MARGNTDHVSIDVGAESVARIVVVADSHSQPHPQAHEWVRKQSPQAILHAGDIGRLTVIDELEDIAPTYAVRGNIDGHDARTPDNLVIDVVRDSDRALRILLTHIGVAGPRLRKDARARAKGHGADLVVCGHSHVPLVAEDSGIAVFNPGSLGPRRFHLPITFGVMQFSADKLQLRHIDCQTGDAWLPPA